MLRCPVCQKDLSAYATYPYAPICSEACRREAMRRAGMSYEEEPADPAAGEGGEQFGEFRAAELFCKQCGRPMPAKERLLLHLPSGDLYGYECARCGADLGTKTDVK